MQVKQEVQSLSQRDSHPISVHAIPDSYAPCNLEIKECIMLDDPLC